MPAAWIAAAGAIGSSIIGSNAAEDAAQTQADAANNASAVQQNMYNQTTQNLSPFLQGGTQGFNALKNNLINPDGSLNTTSPLTKNFTFSDYQKSPGYQFQMEQGIDAAQNAASKSGFGGNTLKALDQFGQGLANSDYQQALSNYTGQQNTLYNKLQNLSGTGQNAAVQQGGFGQNVASQIGSNQIGAGNAIAAGNVAAARGINNGLNSLSNNPNINWNSLFGSNSGSAINNMPSDGGGFIDAGSAPYTNVGGYSGSMIG